MAAKEYETFVKEILDGCSEFPVVGHEQQYAFPENIRLGIDSDSGDIVVAKCLRCEKKIVANLSEKVFSHTLEKS